MSRLISITLTALLVCTTPLAAQKNCKKGIPCGNSCISATKTCRIGSSSAKSPGDSTSTRGSTSVATAGAAWIASNRGTTYYRSGCSGANKLSPSNRIAFKSEEEAQKAGYHRSKTKGC